jgi:hypothetical protein
MTVATGSGRPRRSDSIFYPAMALAAAATVFVGFAPSFYLKSVYQAPPVLSGLMMVHGAVFTAWIAIFIAQTALVAANRRDLHRMLGVAGFAVAGLMLVLGTMLAIDALHRGFTPAPEQGVTPEIFFAVPVGDMIAFALLLALGWRARPRLDYHKRYMLLATVATLDAAVARFKIDFIARGGIPVAFLLVDLFVVALIVYDLSVRRKVHPATMIGGGILVASQVLRLLIGATPAWTAFAHALM